MSDALRKASTDNFLMGLEDVGNTAIIGNKEVSGMTWTSEQFQTLFDQVVRETLEGVSIVMDMIVVVGKKTDGSDCQTESTGYE